MAFKYAVVLTGSISTGKSSVAKIFSSFGWSIIDADIIAHQILDEQFEEIAKLFGTGVVNKEKVLRKKLGKIIFNNKKKRELLESFLHPLIYKKIEQLSSKEDHFKKPYFIDIPLFFETKCYPIEKSLVVYTRKEKQLKRLIKRDGYSEQDALSRIEIQIDIELKRKYATYVIDNNNDMIQLKNECERVKEKILGDFI